MNNYVILYFIENKHEKVMMLTIDIFEREKLYLKRHYQVTQIIMKPSENQFTEAVNFFNDNFKKWNKNNII